MNCSYCGSPAPPKRKYCTWDHSVRARRIIDRDEVARLARQGLTTEQMEAYLPATAGGIRKAMSRQRSAA